jgi:hypothetical protein
MLERFRLSSDRATYTTFLVSYCNRYPTSPSRSRNVVAEADRVLPGSALFLVYQQTLDDARRAMSDYRVALEINYRYDTVL